MCVGITSDTQDRSTVTGTRPVYLGEVFCNGNESSIFQCYHTSNSVGILCSDGAAGVLCQGMHVLIPHP